MEIERDTKIRHKGKTYRKSEINRVYQYIITFDILVDDAFKLITKDPMTGEYMKIDSEDMVKLLYTERKKLGIKHYTHNEIRVMLDVVTILARESYKRRGAYNADTTVKLDFNSLKTAEVI